jgi:hypothetical protein
MKTLGFLVLVFVAAVPASPAQTAKADNSIFGVLKIGERASIPECQKLPSGKYLGVDLKTCFKDALLVTLLADDTMAQVLRGTPEAHLDEPPRAEPSANEEILISMAEEPEIASGDLRAQTIDGNVEFVRFDTAGLSTQDRVLAALKEKYGEPTQIEDVAVKNALGGEFSATSAKWVFGNLSVSFEAAVGRTDHGIVWIASNKGIDFELKKARASQGPKL